jgi:hypothetical protein
MKWPKWTIATGDSGDFLPLLFGGMFLLVSLPAFLMLLFNPDRNSGAIGVPLLVFLGGGILIGVIFIIFGLRICSAPGSRLYRITRGRIFSR